MKKNTVKLTFRGKVVAYILVTILLAPIVWGFMNLCIDEVINHQEQSSVYAEQYRQANWRELLEKEVR